MNRRSIAPLIRACLTLTALFAGALRAQAADVETLLWQGKVTDALQLAQQEATAKPDDMTVQELYIDTMLTLGQAREVGRLYQERVRTNPQDPNSHYLLGRASTDPSQARQSYEKALRINPSHWRSHMGMGAVYLSAGQLQPAEDAYQRAVKGDPSLNEAWMGLIRSHLRQGEQADALTQAEAALKAVPSRQEPYLTVAAMVPERAKALLLKARDVAPADPRVRARLAEALLAEGDAHAALAEARHALNLDPTNADAMLLELYADAQVRGVIDAPGRAALAQARRLEGQEALTTLSQLQQQYPDCALIYLDRARVRAGLGDNQGNLSDLELASRKNPNNIEAIGALGMARMQAKQYAAAEILLAKATKARPWDPSLGQAYGMALLEQDKVPEALTVLGKVADAFPMNSQATITYAEALLNNGEGEQAYAVARRAFDRTGHPDLAVALMLIAGQTGRTREAADILEQLGIATGDRRFIEMAERLRSKAQE